MPNKPTGTDRSSNPSSPTKHAGEYELVVKAYSEVLTIFDEGYPVCRLDRVTGLFMFGFDRQSRLPIDSTEDFDSRACHLRVWRHLASFWSDEDSHLVTRLWFRAMVYVLLLN